MAVGRKARHRHSNKDEQENTMTNRTEVKTASSKRKPKLSDRFYMACLRDTVGTNTAFHAVDGAGYTTDVSKAHVFTKEQTQKFWNTGREFDLPLSADLVDAQTKTHVDCQYIPAQTTLQEGCTKYVGYLKGRWDGNDVFWLQYDPFWLEKMTDNSDCYDADFNKAMVFPEIKNIDKVIWIPFDLANSVKRQTFHVNLINKRSMIQAAGLVTPDHIKRANRKKSTSGKTRWNCPDCGKISWQHNPYDFEGCNACGAR